MRLKKMRTFSLLGKKVRSVATKERCRPSIPVHRFARTLSTTAYHSRRTIEKASYPAVILSRSSTDKSDIHVYSGSEFQRFTFLDRARSPVYADQKDGPTSLNYARGMGSSLNATTRRQSSLSVRPFSTDTRSDEASSMSTLLVRSKPDFSSAKPIATPLFQTGAFESGDPYFYTRASNPNFEDVEELFTRMDGGAIGSVLLSSGMATIAGVLSSLKTGDRVVANTLLYGCSVRFLKDYCASRGIRLDFVDLSCESSRAAGLASSQPNLVFVETPTNPFLRSIPISALAAEAKSYVPNCQIVVDNTWATPLFQRPLELGADVAIYSCSKFFSGHSDLILGVASCREADALESFKRQRFYHGAVPDPFAAWLLRRSMQTLELRMEKHMSSTSQVVDFLESESHHHVEEVFMPHVDGEQLSGYGGLLFFKMKNDEDGSKADRFADALSLFDRGTPMATVRSAVAIPYTGSHASMTPDEKEQIGLGKDIVRLSVGIENPSDLILDLRRAFGIIQSKPKP